MPPDIPTIDDLQKILGTTGGLRRVSFEAAQRIGDDPAHILSYLPDLNRPVLSLAELTVSINDMVDEEELAAHRCQEGVAVVHASDGWMVLFEP